MRILNRVLIGFAFLLASAVTAAGDQKGLGDTEGLVRSGEHPPIQTIQGEILEIRSAPCEKTTGRATCGTHLMVKTGENKVLNLHLGPTNVVSPMIEKLAVGDRTQFEVFRTEKMREDDYIVKSTKVGGQTVTFRDDSYRPIWAGAGQGQMGRQMGRGQMR